jgi:hypothetical protein
MEQFFIVLAVVAIWIFRGVAGAKSRYPGKGDQEDGSLGPGGSIDISARTRQRTLEAQQRAIEALQRWEAKQGLGERNPPEREAPATSRTRTARPAQFRRRTTAERKRREAYAEIAQMVDPVQSGRVSSRPRRGFQPPRVPEPAADVPPVASEVVSLEDPAQLEALKASRRRAGSVAGRASGTPATAAPGGGTSASEPRVTRPGKLNRRSAGGRTPSRLARLEKLPVPARAIVYAEIFGPPRSLP